jgi:hypothetical protein
MPDPADPPQITPPPQFLPKMATAHSVRPASNRALLSGQPSMGSRRWALVSRAIRLEPDRREQRYVVGIVPKSQVRVHTSMSQSPGTWGFDQENPPENFGVVLGPRRA